MGDSEAIFGAHLMEEKDLGLSPSQNSTRLKPHCLSEPIGRLQHPQD